MARLGTAKMFAMMCALEFDRRLRAKGKKGITVNSWSPGLVPTTNFGNSAPLLRKKIMTLALSSAAFVTFMGSHLSTAEDAARGLGGLVMDAKFEGISGRYFDGFEEILSSAESRDTAKARTVWEQARGLGKITDETLTLQ